MDRRAVWEAVAGIALLSVMDAIVKAVASRYPTFEVSFVRYLFGSLAILCLMALVRPGWPSRETLAANGMRAILVVITGTSFFYALGTLPLAETLALSFLSPVFMALFGVLLLRERVDRRVLGALAAGFCGMLVIVSGQIGAGALEASALLGAGAALLSAFTYALAMVMLRARATKDPVVTIVALQNGVPALILIGPAMAVWTPPASLDWALFVAIGILGIAGHLLLARAFAKAEAARLAPLEYTALVWAVLLGFAVFAEVPSLTTLAGAGLIVAAALAASRR